MAGTFPINSCDLIQTRSYGPLDSLSPRAIWQAPLVPAALVITVGMMLDGYANISLSLGLAGILISLIGWVIAQKKGQNNLALIFLGVAGFSIGAAYHQWRVFSFSSDDIGNYVEKEPGQLREEPQTDQQRQGARLVRLRGTIIESTLRPRNHGEDVLRSFPRNESTWAILQASSILQNDSWISVSGHVRLFVEETLPNLQVGDEVEIVGRLSRLTPMANPGEQEPAQRLRDPRIRCEVIVQQSSQAVTTLATGWYWSIQGWLAKIRGGSENILNKAVPGQGSYASAFLLGKEPDFASPTGAPKPISWENYMRAGVLHILVVSGQHLVILSGFIWYVLHFFGVSQRKGTGLVTGFLIGYAILAGARPPVVRPAIMVAACFGGVLFRRKVLTPNTFALAWLGVIIWNPADLFDLGCLLSFLSVFILCSSARWFHYEIDPLDRLIDESRPLWLKYLRWSGKFVLTAYLITILLWVFIVPLVAARSHLVSPIGILIAPPLTLMSSVALVFGFLVLISGGMIPVFGWITSMCLAGCNYIVEWAEKIPGAYWYVPDIPAWWLWVFYLGLLAVLFLEPIARRWRVMIPTALGWLCLGLVVGWARPTPDDFRCTFLAVGHGGCVVLQTPDGRTLLYDAGSLGGPEVTRRHIAPFLWHQGITRIDEVFLSHADLDHFNGLPDLLERFSVGQITCTPTFAEKDAPGVKYTLDTLKKRNVPIRIVSAGEKLRAGRVVMEVLHPPPVGPEGNENARSLVLLVRHEEHAILLTGDLEGLGLSHLLEKPARQVDVLMAPHHGSRTSNTEELANWASPKLTVSCQGPPRIPGRPAEPFFSRGIKFLPTSVSGAVTIRSGPNKLTAETFRTKEFFQLR